MRGSSGMFSEWRADRAALQLPAALPAMAFIFIKEQLGQLAKRHAVIVPPVMASLKDNNFL